MALYTFQDFAALCLFHKTLFISSLLQIFVGQGVALDAIIHVMGELCPYSEVICIPLYSDCGLILIYCMCKLFCPGVGF